MHVGRNLRREVRMEASVVGDHAVEVAGSNAHNDEQHGVSRGPKIGRWSHSWRSRHIYYRLRCTHNALKFLYGDLYMYFTTKHANMTKLCIAIYIVHVRLDTVFP